MTVQENGKVLVFERRVRLNIDPGHEGGNKESGEHKCGRTDTPSAAGGFGPAAMAGFRARRKARPDQRRAALSGLKLSGDKPIQIESDKLEVREAENIAIFTGNVSVVQGRP